MIVDCVSDLHGYKPTLEGGDLLVVAGDLTGRDTKPQYEEFFCWIAEQKYKKKVVVCGNHDRQAQQNKVRMADYPQHFDYLCDSGTEFEGLKIWGAPWTLNFRGQNPECMAFGQYNDLEMQEHWDLIPEDTNILITHSPPLGTLDTCSYPVERVGCRHLAKKVSSLPALKLHVFGHIHEGHGKVIHGDKTFVNAAQMNLYYRPVNKPVRIELG